MSEITKQLKIKTSMLKRLRKQYESYDKETKGINLKLEDLEQKLKNAPNQDTEIDIRKNKQFLDQTKSVTSNVKQKLIEAFEGLATFLSEKGNDQEVNHSEAKANAEDLVLEVETFLENIE